MKVFIILSEVLRIQKAISEDRRRLTSSETFKCLQDYKFLDYSFSLGQEETSTQSVYKLRSIVKVEDLLSKVLQVQKWENVAEPYRQFEWSSKTFQCLQISKFQFYSLTLLMRCRVIKNRFTWPFWSLIGRKDLQLKDSMMVLMGDFHFTCRVLHNMKHERYEAYITCCALLDDRFWVCHTNGLKSEDWDSGPHPGYKSKAKAIWLSEKFWMKVLLTNSSETMQSLLCMSSQVTNACRPSYQAGSQPGGEAKKKLSLTLKDTKRRETNVSQQKQCCKTIAFYCFTGWPTK